MTLFFSQDLLSAEYMPDIETNQFTHMYVI